MRASSEDYENGQVFS